MAATVTEAERRRHAEEMERSIYQQHPHLVSEGPYLEFYLNHLNRSPGVVGLAHRGQGASSHRVVLREQGRAGERHRECLRAVEEGDGPSVEPGRAILPRPDRRRSVARTSRRKSPTRSVSRCCRASVKQQWEVAVTSSSGPAGSAPREQQPLVVWENRAMSGWATLGAKRIRRLLVKPRAVPGHAHPGAADHAVSPVLRPRLFVWRQSR